ncbi:MAG TPA: hypothetical protein VND40_02490 [Nitrososphaerales archaeon]|nr:hypothetical protein [Nitrososphaerales archaeon]
MDAYTKTLAIEGIRNIIFGLQITSAVGDLPSKEDLILLGKHPFSYGEAL